MSKILSRRTLLRGAGGVAIGLPFLEAMGVTAPLRGNVGNAGRRGPHYAPSGFPKRFVAFFNSNGTIYDNWLPTGGETDFQFSRILKPLERHRKDVLILDGIRQMGIYPSGALAGHEAGIAGVLTGQPLNTGPFKGAGNELVGYPNGISVDQAIAAKIGAETKFKSLELGVSIELERNDIAGRMCYSGPNAPVTPESSPYAAFTRLFGDLGADAFEVARRRLQRKTVLDTVLSDYASLQRKLGSEDRSRVDSHLTSIREIEARLDTSSGVGGACEKLDQGPALDVQANDNFPIMGKLQMDLLAMSLACDLTRVASLQWHLAGSYKIFNWLGYKLFHHEYSHEGDSNLEAREVLTNIHTWYAEQVAYLCDKLAAIPEGTGSVLDHTVVLWCNEINKPNRHSLWDAPLVLIGGAGGYFRTGRFLRYRDPATPYDGHPRLGSDVWSVGKERPPHNNLLVSLMNAMGIPVTTFGKPEWCTGVLPRLT